MTGLVQTSSEVTRSWSSSPLIVSRDSFSHQTLARFQTGRAWPARFGCHYIYFCYIIFIFFALLYRFLWPLVLGGCWFVVYIRRFSYNFLNVCRFDYTAVTGSVKVGPVIQFNHTSLVAVATSTDCPKSVCNRCVIELFCCIVCVVNLPFWHFCWCRGFCHRNESDIFHFSFY